MFFKFYTVPQMKRMRAKRAPRSPIMSSSILCSSFIQGWFGLSAGFYLMAAFHSEGGSRYGILGSRVPMTHPG